MDLKDDTAPAYQLRRCAWSAKLPLSILTDFEELAVYDTRIRPEEKDKASAARVLYFRHEEYEPRAEEIWNVFSKRAVLEGRYDTYAEENLKKRGTSEVELRRINPFDWQKAFPEVLTSGGFDAVIGNPPYLKIEHVPNQDRSLLASSYRSLQKRFDVFGLFLELAIHLTSESGLFSFIVPSTLANNLSFAELRRLLLTEASIHRIVNLGGRVFRAANNDTLILIARPGLTSDRLTEILEVPRYGKKLVDSVSLGASNLADFARPPYFTFQLRSGGPAGQVLAKLAAGGSRLGDIVACFQGLVTGGNEAYIITEAQRREWSLEKEVCRVAAFGDEIARYQRPHPRHLVIYLARDDDLRNFPRTRDHLLPYKPILEKKREVQLGRQPWFALHWARDRRNFERDEKILVQAIRNLSLKRRVVATLDLERLFADHTLNVIYATDSRFDVRLALALLNSSLVNFWFTKQHIDINIKGIYLEGVPLPPPLLLGAGTSSPGKELPLLVDQLLKLTGVLERSRISHDRSATEARIAAIDREIDRLVYELYELTPEEIAIVEKG